MSKHCILVGSFVFWAGFLWCQNQALATLQKASTLFDSLRYQEAATLAKQVMHNQKNQEINAQALVLLGDIALELADYPTAKADYHRALKLLKAHKIKGHPLIAQAWNGLGEYELSQGNVAQGIQWHQNALNMRSQLFGQKHEKTADSYNNIGNCLVKQGDYVAAQQMHQKALQIRRSILPANHSDIAVSHNNLGNCAYFIGDFAEAAREHRAALQIREKIFGTNHPKIAPSLNNLGKALLEAGQWDQAQSLFQRVLNIRQKVLGPNHPTLAPTLENIGEALLEKGDFPAAIPYLQQAVYLYGGPNDPGSAPAWHKIGLAYQRSGNYDEALSYHLVALGPIETQYGDQVYAATIYSNIAVCYLQKKEYPLSILNFSIAAKIFHQYFPEGHPDLAQMHNNLAICYVRQGFLAQASTQSQQALQALQQIGQTKGLGYAQVLRTRAEILLQQNKITESSALLQKALQVLAYRPGQTLWGNEITFEVMEILAQQARTWKAEAISATKQSNALHWQKKAADANLEALRLMGFLRRQMSTSAARQYWLQQQYALYSEATEINFRIWQQSGEQTYLEKAFVLSERSKAVQLLEAVQLGQAKAQSAVPADMEKLETNLLSRLAELESEKITSPTKTPQLERKMLVLMRRLDSLQRVMLRWQKKKGINPVADSVYSAQLLRKKLLRPQQAMVEYFETGSSLLVFVLSKDQFTGFALPKSTSILQQAIDFRLLLRAYPALNGAALDSNLIAWTKLSYALHQEVFAPLQSALKGIEELIVIPDGPLGFLPFEALLSKMPKKIGHFKSHAYLLRQYAIQYCYSGSLCWELSRKSHTRLLKPSLLSMAPDFKGHSLGLGTLYNNKVEAAKLGKLWGAKVLTGHAANLAAFVQLAPHYSILHLATHGKYFRDVDNYSALAFAEQKDTLSNDYLYTRDLYALRLPTELVVLSACETGIGDYHQGEGIISLAHGFIHAGAKSVVTTLWSVDDARTADIVVDFFQKLKKGQKKHIALQQAKLDLLHNRPHDEVHPYYWSGLIGVGATQALCSPHKLVWGMGIFLTLIVAIIWTVRIYLRKFKQ